VTSHTEPPATRPAPTPKVADPVEPVVPDVAVILIGYNDVERLPTAVASVLDQTLANLELIIVDDASTDGMGELADSLAAQSPKIRSIRLPVNSAGCSQPRNVGLGDVRARYVMFLDSDDVLERHACKNLLLAIERSGADFASGRCVRVDMDTGVETGWLRDLYDEPAVWEGVGENPELLNDTLCTNKLYRLSFLNKHDIRFPEGLHYEDLAFTAEVYCSAERIAIIPEVVYLWRIYGSYPQASIHRRRDNITNFKDRLAIHRIIDAFLQREGLAEMKALIDDRFLRLELKIYLRELGERSATYQRQWMRLASGYLRGIDITRVMSQSRSCRLATYLVRQGDLELAVAAAELWIDGRVAIPLVQRGDTVYFADAYLDDPIGRQVMDVTWLHAHDAKFSQLPLFVRLSELTTGPGTIRLRGVVLNQLGRLPSDGGLRLTLRLRHEHMWPGLGIDFPVGNVTLDPEQLTWEAEVDIAALPRGRRKQLTWHVSLRVGWRDEINGQAVSALAAALPDDRGRPAGSRPALRSLTPDLTRRGTLALQDNRPVPPLPLTTRLSRRAMQIGAVRAATGYLAGRRIKAIVYRQLLRRLPLRPDTVVFESHLGKQYSDSPKYLYEELVSTGLPYRTVWSYQKDPSRFPDAAVKVQRDSWRYYYELARAKYLVDNQGFPAVVVRRPGQRYLQTWHGSPFKHMGFDDPGFARTSPEVQQRLQQAVSRWDDFVVMSEWSEQVFQQAFRLRTRPLRTGYPRNDPLHRANDPDFRREVRERLGLPANRKILLYAPTFRRYPKALTTGNPANAPRIDLKRFEEALGEEWLVVLRAHYLDRMTVPRRYANVARNMTRYDDISDLLVVADAVVTDYSSVMFDYAITGRPMAFYTSDYELYRLMRGSYFDLPDEAPGPTVLDTAAIISWLQDLDATHASYEQRYRAFQARYCEFETGSAAATIIRQVFLDEPTAS
jgi:CDP-glycerol glycerophosphotransferase